CVSVLAYAVAPASSTAHAPKAMPRFIPPSLRLATRVAVAVTLRLYARAGAEVKKKAPCADRGLTLAGLERRPRRREARDALETRGCELRHRGPPRRGRGRGSWTGHPGRPRGGPRAGRAVRRDRAELLVHPRFGIGCVRRRYRPGHASALPGGAGRGPAGPVRLVRARRRPEHLAGDAARNRPRLSSGEARALHRLRAIGLRVRRVRDGPLLLPGRREGLRRSRFLPRVEAPLRCARRLRAGLRHRP